MGKWKQYSSLLTGLLLGVGVLAWIVVPRAQAGPPQQKPGQPSAEILAAIADLQADVDNLTNDQNGPTLQAGGNTIAGPGNVIISPDSGANIFRTVGTPRNLSLTLSCRAGVTEGILASATAVATVLVPAGQARAVARPAANLAGAVCLAESTSDCDCTWRVDHIPAD